MAQIKKGVLITFLFFIFIFAASAAFAWPDGDREGLLMGVTGGFASTEFDTGTTTHDGTSFMAGVYLGAGLSEQFLLSFRYRYFNTDTDWTTFHSFLWGADAIFYPVAKSNFFITGGLSRMMVTVDSAYVEDKWGMAFHAGVGYEITKWVFLMADYTHASLDDDIDGSSITIAVAAIGY